MDAHENNAVSQLVLENRHAPLKRSLYSLASDGTTPIPDSIRLPDTHLALFLAWDARGATAQEIGALASALFAKGLSGRFIILKSRKWNVIHLAASSKSTGSLPSEN